MLALAQTNPKSVPLAIEAYTERIANYSRDLKRINDSNPWGLRSYRKEIENNPRLVQGFNVALQAVHAIDQYEPFDKNFRQNIDSLSTEIGVRINVDTYSSDRARIRAFFDDKSVIGTFKETPHLGIKRGFVSEVVFVNPHVTPPDNARDLFWELEHRTDSYFDLDSSKIYINEDIGSMVIANSALIHGFMQAKVDQEVGKPINLLNIVSTPEEKEQLYRSHRELLADILAIEFTGRDQRFIDLVKSKYGFANRFSAEVKIVNGYLKDRRPPRDETFNVDYLAPLAESVTLLRYIGSDLANDLAVIVNHYKKFLEPNEATFLDNLLVFYSNMPSRYRPLIDAISAVGGPRRPRQDYVDPRCAFIISATIRGIAVSLESSTYNENSLKRKLNEVGSLLDKYREPERKKIYGGKGHTSFGNYAVKLDIPGMPDGAEIFERYELGGHEFKPRMGPNVAYDLVLKGIKSRKPRPLGREKDFIPLGKREELGSQQEFGYRIEGEGKNRKITYLEKNDKIKN